MRRPTRLTLFRWLLAAFFAFGAMGNLFPTEGIMADYQRWGFPDWFHYLTGTLELAASALMFSRYRLVGALAGAAVMAAATTTVLFHGEFLHALIPATVLALCLLLAALLRRQMKSVNNPGITD